MNGVETSHFKIYKMSWSSGIWHRVLMW